MSLISALISNGLLSKASVVASPWSSAMIPKSAPTAEWERQSHSNDTVTAVTPVLTLPYLVLCVLFGILCVAYSSAVYFDLAPFWFNPDWTTDDALQQVYPFFQALYPERFSGDIITSTMKGYLAPLHWWLGYGLTRITKNPIMASHWMMTLQLGGAVVFLFLLVRRLASTPAAFFAVAWMLHTRPLVQRVTAGLPRGWSPLVLSAFLYFVVTRRHGLVLLTLAVGCLTNPPATLIAALAYGLHLVWGVIRQESRAENLKPLVYLVALSPFYVLAVLYVVHRPESVGQMVDFATASAMPEFQRPHGRFPFLPLDPIWWDVRMYGYQPFNHRLFNPGQAIKRLMPYLLPSLSILLVLVLAVRRRLSKVSAILFWFLISVVTVYSASRVLAFKLYVPNRHLQIPMAMWWISFFSVALWHAVAAIGVRGGSVPVAMREGSTPLSAYDAREFGRGVSTKLGFVMQLLAFGGLATLVWIGSGDGLYGTANFNYSRFKKGAAFEWLRKNSEPAALVAGHPTHIDAVPLFAERRAFATTETTHPFYPRYYNEIKRRLELSLRAHYATSLSEVVELMEPQGVDYFVFSRKRFYPEVLKEERFFSPLSVVVDELTSRDPQSYAYKALPRQMSDETKYFMPFRDDQSVVVSIAGLKKYLATAPSGSSEAPSVVSGAHSSSSQRLG